jgi:PAS domain S-box-containing protein/TyrR family helix-turn-helix protein
MEEQLTIEQIFNATSNGLIATDTKGRIITVNEEACKIIGLDRVSVEGENITDLLPLTGYQVSKCLSTGEPQLGRHIRGKRVRLVSNVNPIRRNGEVRGAVCCFQEMHQFEESARQLESYKQMNNQLKAIFKTVSDGIWVCDNTGTVIDINQASEKLNGVKAEDIIGKRVKDLIADDFFDKSVTLEVMETKRQISLIQYQKKTKKFLLITGTPDIDDDGNINLIVLTERDMTQLNEIREQLEQSRMETERVKDELLELNMRELKEHQIIVGKGKMRETLQVALKLSRIDASNILILGESGTGKGLLAKFIHQNSKRSNKPFIQINCAALPENLLEAELFGYERGAFTGANERGKIGLFELAHEGTLFLDEIGDLPLQVQAKLLKYLDDHEIMRLGSTVTRKTECKIIAATNRDLKRLSDGGRFRRDLFYRLNTFTLHIPALRERADCIFELVNHYLDKYNQEYGQDRRMSPRVLDTLQSYYFPGNVRELQNLVKKAVVMSESKMLDDFIINSIDVGSKTFKEKGKLSEKRQTLFEKLSEVEKKILEEASKSFRSTREIASHLGVSQPTIVRKLKKYGIATSMMQY